MDIHSLLPGTGYARQEWKATRFHFINTVCEAWNLPVEAVEPVELTSIKGEDGREKWGWGYNKADHHKSRTRVSISHYAEKSKV